MNLYLPATEAPIATLPIFLSQVPAGFPSPAEDYVEGQLDLNEHLVTRPAATFFVRATGDSMIGIGIRSGDLLIVDKSLSIRNGQVIIAAVNGELAVKQLSHRTDGTYLVSANEKYPAKKITDDSTFEVWGVVTYVIHRV